MPAEYTLLREQALPITSCPNCGDEPFDPFIRGMVQRSRRFLWIGPKQDYCALICSKCKKIVGYESPKQPEEKP